MSKFKAVLYVVLVAFFVSSGAYVVTAAQDVGPEKIQIESKLYGGASKGPVEFTHKKHAEEYKIACTDCHHVYKDGKNVWKPGEPVQKCEACHNEPTVKGEKKLPPDKQKLNLKIAFHENCISCHKTVKKDKPATTAPITCKGCHPKGDEKE